MSGYGAPPSGPSGFSGPQGPAGSSGPGGLPKNLPLFDLIAAGLGVLMFLIGFFDWYDGEKGFLLGGASIGLSLAAAGIAGAVILSEKADPPRPPYAAGAAAAAFLVTVGLILGKPGDSSTTVAGSTVHSGPSYAFGIWLALLVTLAQTGLLIFSWLQTTGKVSGPKLGGGGAQQWGAPGGYDPSGQAGGYGQPGQYGQPGGYGQPGESGPSAQPGQSGQPGQYGQPGGYGQPGQYGQPSSTPSYNPPTGGYMQPPAGPQPTSGSQPGQQSNPGPSTGPQSQPGGYTPPPSFGPN